MKRLPRKGGGRRAPLSPTLSSRICLVLLRAVENEPKRLLDRLLGKILQKSQEDPAAASIKRAGSAGVLRETPVPITAPSPPSGTADPEAAPASATPRAGERGSLACWRICSMALKDNFTAKSRGPACSPRRAYWCRSCQHLCRRSLGRLLF